MAESKSMQELHKIREENYEKTKSMTNDEYVKYIHDGANDVRKRLTELRNSKHKAV